MQVRHYVTGEWRNMMSLDLYSNVWQTLITVSIPVVEGLTLKI